MRELTIKYPELAIMGSIPSVKYSRDIKKYQAAKEAYGNYKWIQASERDSIFPSDKHTERELANFKKIRRPSEGFHLIRRTFYVFQNGEVWRHDKAAPFHETRHNKNSPNLIFQPGKGRNLSSLCTLEHPFTKAKIPISADLCLENQYGVAYRTVQSQSFLYVLLSDTTPLNLDHVKRSKFAIQLDSKQKSRLITLEDIPIHELPIEYYQTNLLDDNPVMIGPLTPVYPMRLFMDSRLAKLKELLRSTLPEFDALQSAYGFNSLLHGSAHEHTLKPLLSHLDILEAALPKTLTTNTEEDIAVCIQFINEIRSRAHQMLNENIREDYQVTTDAAVFKK